MIEMALNLPSTCYTSNHFENLLDFAFFANNNLDFVVENYYLADKALHFEIVAS